MKKTVLYKDFEIKYENLKAALAGDDLDRISSYDASSCLHRSSVDY